MNALQYIAFRDELEKIAKSNPTLRTSIKPVSTTSRVLKNLTSAYNKLGVRVHARHTSDPTRGLRLQRTGRSSPLRRGEGAIANLQRLMVNKQLPTGMTWRDLKAPSFTNLGISSGRLSAGVGLTNKELQSLNLGVRKNLTKNVLLNLGVQIPVGKGASQRKPYFMGGIGGSW
jgi:hypothetical protein